MFELSVARKYLTPRWRQLSVSIISLISILVIALVVWLVVVFFSVTHGLEKSWIEKLTALTAPVRILPTEAYYRSYYYLADSMSSESGYSHKTIREKALAPKADPFDPEMDQELPDTWPTPDRNSKGEVKDLVKLAYNAAKSLEDVPGLYVNDFEIAVGNLRLHLQRNVKDTDRFLSQTAYLGNFDPNNRSLTTTLLPPSQTDLKNLKVAPEQIYKGSQIALPSDDSLGDGVLLPKGYREAGVLAGDQGHISYYVPTTSSLQEQQLPIYVAGFYDPGIFPIGGKYVLINPEVLSQIRSENHNDNTFASNGINIRFTDLEQTDAVKAALQEAFAKEGIAPYWRIETYKEYEFTKDLIQQLRSERNLWTLIAAVIIIVACSNIISMLVILVNDKKTEIGILRSMGASAGSIAAIFGICGIVMGTVGSVIGTTVAVFTLHNLQTLIDFIGRMQGYEMFNPVFYGNILPNQISIEALLFVIITTAIVSLLAGIVPAIKACMVRPSTILRAE